MATVTAPDRLGEIEAEVSRLQQAWPDAVALRPARYSHFCFLADRFAPAFPHVTEDDLVTLSVGGQLFVTAVLLRDTLLDRACPAEDVGLVSMRIMALEAEAMGVFRRLFPPSARFWERHRTYLADHARAFVEEDAFRRGRRPLAEYGEDVALGAGRDKIGLARVAIAALAELEGDDRLLGPIEASLAHVGEAMALHDDVADWKEDLRRGQPSLVLSRVVAELPGPLDDADWESLLAGVGRAIHYGGHSRDVLRLALRSLDAADRLEESLPGLPWYTHTRALRRVCEAWLDELGRVVRD
jgi:hypothetical protein